MSSYWLCDACDNRMRFRACQGHLDGPDRIVAWDRGDHYEYVTAGSGDVYDTPREACPHYSLRTYRGEVYRGDPDV